MHRLRIPIYLIFCSLLFTASSALIVKAESENNQLSSLSGDNISGTGVRIGRGEDAVADGTNFIMDSAQPAMIKHADYVVGRSPKIRDSLTSHFHRKNKHIRIHRNHTISTRPSNRDLVDTREVDKKKVPASRKRFFLANALRLFSRSFHYFFPVNFCFFLYL